MGMEIDPCWCSDISTETTMGHYRMSSEKTPDLVVKH
jgi:hypothetical protein